MSYTDDRFLSQSLTIERVSSKGSDGNQDKTYSTAEAFQCREIFKTQIVKDQNGDEVTATSFAFIHTSIFSVPEYDAQYTLPSGEIVQLATAKAIKEVGDADTIKHWEAYFTKPRG